MRIRAALVVALAGGLTAPPAPAAAAERKVIAVHFTARATPVDKAQIKADAKARQAEAGQKAKDLEKKYKAQYGKNDGKWPPGSVVEIARLKAEASGDEGVAVEADYASASPKELTDSVHDLTAAVKGYGGGVLRVVAAPAEADLVVEVTGRHSSKSDAGLLLDDVFGFILKIGPGGKVDPARLEDAVAAWSSGEPGELEVNELHGYSADEPYWMLQLMATVRWVNLANQSVALLADFVRTNDDLFAKK